MSLSLTKNDDTGLSPRVREASGLPTPYATEGDQMDTNPLRIHMARAEALRKYRELSINSSGVPRNPGGNPYSTPPFRVIEPITIWHEHYSQLHVSQNDTIRNSSLGSRIDGAIDLSLSQISGIPIYRTIDETRPEQLGLPLERPVNPRNRGEKSIKVDDRIILYSKSDINWPQSTPTYTNNIEKLISDWSDSSYITLKGSPIPMKYWNALLTHVDSEAWKTFRKHYSEMRVSAALEPGFYACSC